MGAIACGRARRELDHPDHPGSLHPPPQPHPTYVLAVCLGPGVTVVDETTGVILAEFLIGKGLSTKNFRAFHR